MNKVALVEKPIDSGLITFSIESRIVRELGERLVKEPEVALLELIKNAYDADAALCKVTHGYPQSIAVVDDGHGMTLKEFKNGWMRVGTSSKEKSSTSRRFLRDIVGEKGIGRFAVRYLGRKLRLESIAFDEERSIPTRLEADFDWPKFDRNEDLGKIEIPWKLFRAPPDAAPGTTLTITSLRPTAEHVDFRELRTSAINVVSPYHTLLGLKGKSSGRHASADAEQDPGFRLEIEGPNIEPEQTDIAKVVLDAFVLRAQVELRGDRLKFRLYRKGEDEPHIKIDDKYSNSIGDLHADIRFFPWRKGTFSELPVKGMQAQNWVRNHSGVAVFDRSFRVHPYGTEGDDWLKLSADQSRSHRIPRSTIAQKHFKMDKATQASTQLNYMLRLPYPYQLVGAVRVAARRTEEGGDDGLIAAADREGFVSNETFQQFWDVVRGAAEVMAFADRELQKEQEEAERKRLQATLRKETREAIKEVQANPKLSSRDKLRIVERLSEAESYADRVDELEQRRETSLEVMSLLGVVAGFMTHEFGTAIDQLERARDRLLKLARTHKALSADAEEVGKSIALLKEFTAYSQGYVRGAATVPVQPYLVRPRIQQVVRVFGKYAAERGIEVAVDVESDLVAPLVPVSLYNGIALNLFTNALKAITARVGKGEQKIAFRAWNDARLHHLQVSDTGVGISAALHERIFDPLFTTTESNRDPLGSGMGLGLPLLRRGVEGFKGKVEVTTPPPGFSTCFHVRLPLSEAK